jgi:dihydrofolate reductase
MAEPLVALVVAVADNGVIGRAGRLPWRIPTDLKSFRRLTLDKPVVMGRKTYQSIGRPLDRRDNIVVTRDPGFRPDAVVIAASVEEALARGREMAKARGSPEIAVIGGAEIFAQVLPAADRIYLTRVHAEPEGDVRLPPLPEGEWREVLRQPLPHEEADEFACTLVVLERATKS